jgi:hypothetical protein
LRYICNKGEKIVSFENDVLKEVMLIFRDENKCSGKILIRIYLPPLGGAEFDSKS